MKRVSMQRCLPKVSASLMCAPLLTLGAAVEEIESAGIDMIHVDVMDGSFVPNFTLGPDVIRALRRSTSLPVDVHLMAVSPERHLDTFLDCGIQYFSFHYEACRPLVRSLEYIKQAGVHASVAINPATPVNTLECVLPLLDFVLLMTVEPGYAGQPLVPFAFEKIADLKNLITRLNVNVEIEVDGNVSFEHAPAMVAAGADILVGGSSSIFQPGMTITEGYNRLICACAASKGTDHDLA